MKTVIISCCIVIAAAGLIGPGCSSTSQLTTKQELLQKNGKGPIRALTVDTLLYTFDTFSFTDSLLSGIGTVKRNDQTAHFAGSVPFDRIVFIEGLDINYWKPLWLIPMMAATVGGFMIMTNDSRYFEIHRPSGGSCPYVYAFDGKRFRLEAEAFGTSISKVLEGETFSVLSSLRAVDGRLRIRMSNERPETHLLNKVRLFATDAPTAEAAVLDTDNRLWPLVHAVHPSAARDHSGQNILTEISDRDDRYWKSDMAHTAPLSGFRDQLELEFDLPQNATEATLVVHAINTDLITEAYRSVGDVLGDATLQFYYALEHDAELQGRIREWIGDCNLRVEVARGADWEEAGRMMPEANVAPFSRAIRLRGLDAAARSLRVRLSSLTDVWRIDAVTMDFSQVKPLTLQPLEMLSVRASDGSMKESAVRSIDSSYALILPGNHLDIEFDAKATLSMRHPVYVIAAQGYLYEWFTAQPETGPLFVSGALKPDDRIAMLKLLISQKDLFLPPVYARWRKTIEAKN